MCYLLKVETERLAGSKSIHCYAVYCLYETINICLPDDVNETSPEISIGSFDSPNKQV